MTDDLLTAEEVAERLDVSAKWVYAEVRAGRIPHLRLGRLVRFRRSSIEAWIVEIERPAAYNGHPTKAARQR